MRLDHFCKFALLLGLLYAPLAMARIGYTLTQMPITLGSYDPTQTQVAKISHNGRLFGQIDSWGNARVWLLENPTFPYLELPGDPPRGQIFVDLSFSADGQYIIFDSIVKSTNLQPRGRIIVVSTSTFQQQSFDTFIWGGSRRSQGKRIKNSAAMRFVP